MTARWILQPFLLGLLVMTAVWYARERDVPLAIAAALFPAFLLELGLYFATASEKVRSIIAAQPRILLAAGMTLAALPSYLVYSIPTGVFSWMSAGAILAMAGVASFWYVLLGRRSAADIGFLPLMAAPVLFKIFDDIYGNATARIPMQTLGVIMWYRTGILAVLALREAEGVGFGLLPRKIDWSIGVRNFLLFLPVGLVAAFALEFVRPTLPEFTLRLLGNAVLYFVGTLWFLAVAEEFFFRGLLQQTLSRVLKNRFAGLILASLLFGLVHLGFREFPNWRFALLAGIAGIFYGRAYMEACSIRAAMVTHALVVTMWRVFLS